MRQTVWALLTGASLLAFAPQAAAQEQTTTAGPSAGVSHDIIVSARRRDEAVQDVPVVINAVTAEAIADLNLRSFNDVTSIVPGLDLSSSSDGVAGSARLRGVNFDTRASGNNATVEFYFNDASISAGVILQQMYDIQQIEVQRGPQGTLRGRSSPSGSITITTRKPNLDEIGGYVDVTGNDIGTINLNGGINIPVIPGIAAIRVAGLLDESNGDLVRPINTSFDGRDPYGQTKSGRISALVEPTDWLRLEGTYQRMERNARNYDLAISFSEANPAAPPSPVVLTAKDRRSIQERPTITRQQYDIYNWRGEVAALGQRLIYQGQHTKQQVDNMSDGDPANLFTGANIQQPTHVVATGTSHEVRLQNDERVLGMFDYVLGFFDNTLDSPTQLTRPTIVRLPLVLGGGLAQVARTVVQRDNETHEQSFFGHLTWHIGDATELSGGLRSISYNAVGGTIVNGAQVSSEDLDDNHVVYTASATHRFSDDFMVYASTGSSYRPAISVVGNFNIAPSQQEQDFTNLPPETSQSYEIGFKSTMLDKRLRFNLTGYHQKFENFPYRSPNGVFYVNTVALRDPVTGQVTGTAQQVASFNFVGAVPVEVNGVEGELSFDVTDNWNIGVVASYSLGEIKNGTIPCNDLNNDGVPDAVTVTPTLPQLQAAVGADNVAACVVNQRAAFLAPFSAAVTSEYNFPVSGKLDAYVRGLLSFNGKSEGDPTNAFDDVGAYGLLNLFTGIRDPDGMWDISIFAKNLFDTTKVLNRTDPFFTGYQQLGFGGIVNGRPVFTGPTAATYTSTYTGGSLTPPREFGLNVRFALGSR